MVSQLYKCFIFSYKTIEDWGIYDTYCYFFINVIIIIFLLLMTLDFFFGDNIDKRHRRWRNKKWKDQTYKRCTKFVRYYRVIIYPLTLYLTMLDNIIFLDSPKIFKASKKMEVQILMLPSYFQNEKKKFSQKSNYF